MILAHIIILTPTFKDFVLARCKQIMFEPVYVYESLYFIPSINSYILD